jgi:hypothetical protein
MQVNEPAVIAELKELYSRYETALMTNDVGGLTAFFWDSPFATRFGITENLHGFEEIGGFRKGRSPANLERRIRRLDIVSFGQDYGEISLEFERNVDGRLVLGRQSQTWVKFAEGWRIVAAHVSLLP